MGWSGWSPRKELIFWRLKKLDMFLPPTDAFSSLGSSNLNPPKKMMRDFGRISSQTSAKQLIAFLLLDHPKFGYLCWDMLGYPCLLSHLRWSSLSLSGYAPAWAAKPCEPTWWHSLGRTSGCEPWWANWACHGAARSPFSQWSYLGGKKDAKTVYSWVYQFTKDE